MPARIVLAHDDADFLKRAVVAIRSAGYDVAAFDRSMARRKIPDLKVLFVAQPEHQEHTDGIDTDGGPINIPELVDRVSEMLAE